MQLSLYSDYALRLLIKLALEPERLHTIREVAEAYGVSHHHLTKIAQELGRHGFVETVRGRGGGIRLNRPADQIVVGDVFRRTEENLALVDCFDPARPSCAISSACRLKHVLNEALGAFLAVLDGVTIADLTEEKDALRALLPHPR